MRSLRLRVCVGAAWLLLLCVSADAEQRGGPRGFDHAVHAQRVDLAGGAAVPCTRCHAMDPRGRVAHQPGHAACFGECHGPRPVRGPKPEEPARRAVCTVCHDAEALDQPAVGRASGRAFAVPAGPLSAPEHALAMSHAAHDAPSQARGGCRACHAPGQEDGQPGARGPAAPATDARPGARPGPGAKVDDAHARCTRCHLPAPGVSTPAPGLTAGAAKTGPVSMNECGRCHVAAAAGARLPALAPGPYRASFSHARHRARGHGDCGGCHVAVLAASGNELPAPRTEQCAGCHDGVQAFSVLGPTCRRCHDERGPHMEIRAPRGPGYSHRQHQEHGLELPCTRCHQLDARGIPQPPAADHAPCSDAGCHREEFMARTPKICGACHLGTEPWQRLYFQARGRLDTEFGARFSHRLHQQADANLIGSCERCHRQPSQQRDLGLPAQHATCMATGCHERVGIEIDHPVGPTPLTVCTACHELDLVANRRAQRLQAPWSVRERFDHAQHRSQPGSGAAVPCTTCHQGVAEADRVTEIPGPPKRACAPCHDGRAAFKLTGHGCARCHGGAGQP
ncbi:MAG TPA: cytochrome c3 family protein [Haliangium sp.]|nr:cytochrome c3 family protein [Haliangium sp.]